jgi:hypothetical protein
LPPPRCVTGYTTLILALLCRENFHGGIFPQNEAAFVRFSNKMYFVFSKDMVVSLAQFGVMKSQPLQEMKIISMFATKRLTHCGNLEAETRLQSKDCSFR